MWKRIPDFPYHISARGDVKSMRTGRLLKQETVTGGYKRVDLRNKNLRRRELVHRLVLEVFVGPAPEGKEGAHLDGNPDNNSISNLKWKTPIENHADKFEHGTMPMGERHHACVVLDEHRRYVLESSKTIAELARELGYDRNTLHQIRLRNKEK